jgi:hypothetical protein
MDDEPSRRETLRRHYEAQTLLYMRETRQAMRRELGLADDPEDASRLTKLANEAIDRRKSSSLSL